MEEETSPPHHPRTPPTAPPLTLEELATEAPEAIEGLASNSWIEVDRKALRQNIENLQRFFRPAEMVSVVKGNAYGHGWELTIPTLEEAGLKRLAVYSAHEAMHVKEYARPDTTVEIMGYTHPSEVAWAVENGCVPWIGTMEAWPAFRDEIERQEKVTRFHIEVETGMNRLGVPYAEVPEIAREIQHHPYARLEGICTHLAGAEDRRNEARIQQQRRRFLDLLEELKGDGIDPERKHIASSSAALLYPDSRLDQVRIGIATYGFWPTREVRHRLLLQNGGEDLPVKLFRALAWKSRVMNVRDVLDGEYVGYGDSHQAEGNERIAIVPVGYADGFSRALSNLGYVLIRGRRASIIGPVNMNMIQVHVTHIPDLEVGDEVTLIGRQGDQEITVGSFSDYNNIVNYEFMCRLSEEIPRVPIEDGTWES